MHPQTAKLRGASTTFCRGTESLLSPGMLTNGLRFLFLNVDEEIEWAVGLGMRMRLRVKDQQERSGSAEFRNTDFSYHTGLEGVEESIVTPELQGDSYIGSDPLPPGQVRGLSPGAPNEYAGLYRVDINVGPGSGVKILNVGSRFRCLRGRMR
jgi:predicted ATP-dependent Lon-type protease